MTTRSVSLNEAEELLERAVTEKGADYVYGKRGGACNYERDGAPSCIVGHVLSYLGLTVEQLATLDNPDKFYVNECGYPVSADTGITDIAQLLASELGIDLTFPAAELLQNAQFDQDNGVPWGTAVVLAKDAVGQYRD